MSLFGDRQRPAARVKPAAVAGMFYDADPAVLRREVESFLERAAPGDAPSRVPKAVIAPHAGYIYSGGVAGTAYATVKAARDRIKRVVLLGPSHRVYVPGLAASTASAFATPLGNVSLDLAAIGEIVETFPFVDYADEAFQSEHSLEVQLPFLQALFEGFELLPFAVGDATAEQVDTVLDRLWGGDETLVVVSSDLSHFRSYEAAREIDRFTSEEIRRLRDGALTGEHACGYKPISGLLRAAARHGLECEVLDMRSSGDAAGMRDRVVGYGAYAFYPR